MARPKECPKCGADISESHIDDDPDCGITAGWYCEVCDKGYPDDDDGSDDYFDPREQDHDDRG